MSMSDLHQWNHAVGQLRRPRDHKRQFCHFLLEIQSTMGKVFYYLVAPNIAPVIIGISQIIHTTKLNL